MINDKNFKTIENQIDILKNRGLSIKNDSEANLYLLTNNYYNIINGYSKYFMKQGTDEYIESASFDEIRSLYLFDKEIKKSFFDAILNAEHHLKAIFAYRFAQEYQGKRYAYLDINSYDANKTLDAGYIISSISRIINKNKDYKNNAIYHYVKKYNDVPIWVLVDFIDFGLLKNLIECIPSKLKNKIAKDMTNFIKDNNYEFNGVFGINTMLSFIKNIHETRNICAHNNRLLGFTCRSDSIFFEDIHSKFLIKKNHRRRDVYTTFVNLQCFLSKNEYAILNNTIRKRIRNLDRKLTSINIINIIDLLGFPEHWEENEKMKQN